jgi:hypothetical protein
MSAPPATAARRPAPSWWCRLGDRVATDGVRRAAWLGACGALGIYALSRLAQLAVLSWLIPPGGAGVGTHLLVWDGGWFIRVATEGYPAGYSYDAAGTMVGNGYAFFPLYPLFIRLGMGIGLSPPVAALAVAWLAGAAAAVLLYLLGARMAAGSGPGAGPGAGSGPGAGAWPERRAGWLLVALVCAQPMAMVLSMGYSEALFLALAAGALLAAHHRAWEWAGGLGLAAGLTRPAGVAVAVAVLLAAALAWRRAAPRERWRAGAAAAVASAAVPGYLVWVAVRVGDLDAWFRIQTAGWGSTFDLGTATWAFLLEALRGGDGWVHVSAAWLLLAAMVAGVVALLHRLWPPLAAYGLVSLALVVGQAGYWHSKPRLLVPVVWILVPAAAAAARARTGPMLVVLGGYAVFGLWYGAYLVAVWPYTM